MALYVNHRDLCRFDGRNDPSYRLVKDTLQDVFQQITKPSKNYTISMTTNDCR